MEGEVRSISFNFIKGNLPRQPLLTSDVIKRHKITGSDNRGLYICNMIGLIQVERDQQVFPNSNHERHYVVTCIANRWHSVKISITPQISKIKKARGSPSYNMTYGTL